MRILITAAGAAAVAAVIGGAVGYRTAKRQYLDDHASFVRFYPHVLTLTAKNRPPGDVLIIGDSITELSGVTSLCGRPAFNAGVASATLADVAPMAAGLAASLRPSRVFIQIGSNDARPGEPIEPAEWAGRYKAMIRQLGGAPVVIVPAPALEPAKAKVQHHDPQLLDRLNAQLPALARETGARLLPRPVAETHDGVHLTPAGVRIWSAGLEAGCH